MWGYLRKLLYNAEREEKTGSRIYIMLYIVLRLTPLSAELKLSS